jgi:7-keto-8-aminopelargonate synthetase-like enzyme
MKLVNSKFVALALGSAVLALTTACGSSETSAAKPSQEKAGPASQTLSNGVQLTKVKSGGFLGLAETNALLAHKPNEAVKGFLVVSPGASIPVDKMKNLASKFAEKGYATFVTEYVANLAIIPTEQKRAFDLAKRIYKGDKFENLRCWAIA